MRKGIDCPVIMAPISPANKFALISENACMMTIFNRKELLMTMDLKKQADVREILSANHIPYVIKTTNLTNRGRQGVLL